MGATVKISSRDLGLRALVSLVDRGALDPVRVVAGIRQDDGAKRVATEGPPGARRAVEGGPSSPTLAEVAAANEFGAPGVPERPFMRETFDENVVDYAEITARGIGRVVDGDETIEQIFGIIGLRIKDDIQRAIVEIRTPKNSDETIERKGSSNPLIDTGRMHAAIGFELVDGEGDS